MKPDSTQRQKRFDSDSVYVSYFPHIAPASISKLSPEEKALELQKGMNEPIEMPLDRFLNFGGEHPTEIGIVRAEPDKKKRQYLKSKYLGAAMVCITVFTRDKDVLMEDKLKNYNALIVLDFDGIDDLQGLRATLESLPWVYYAGLSVSGNGMFAVIPLDNDDYKKHPLFFDALNAEMHELGYDVDKNCRDITRLRYYSYDPNPYWNKNCELYRLPEGWDEQVDDDFEFEELEPKEISNDERLEQYVREWERKKVPLDDYGDWMTIGMALSGQGENGRNAFHRVSRFSGKYNPKETDKSFDGFVRDTRSIGIGSFYYKCNQYGVIPDTVPHYENISFPVEVFPKKIQEVVYETHKHQNFPIDYIAPCLLFSACLACGNAAVVELNAGWREKALLYMAIVGGRGTNKTGCFDFALGPIRDKDNDEYDDYLDAKAKYDAECLKPAKERKLPPEPPLYRQYILSDFTPEVLVRQHKASSRGLIVFSDELIGFILSFNKYRSGADEQMWTQLFAGGGVTVNRVGSDPIKINDTCIGILGGIQPELLGTFARGKIQSGFVDRWLFIFPDKVPYPKFNDVDIDPEIEKRWKRIVDRILKIPFEGTPKVVKLSPGAKQLYKEWYDKLSEQKNNGGSKFAGLATKMDRYCGRLALGLEIMKYGCKLSQLSEIAEDSMRGAIALSYYFIACGLKAHKKFVSSPIEELPSLQREIYDELPQSFDTKKGVEIATDHGMAQRTFKRWLSTSMFKKISYGYYEKRYR